MASGERAGNYDVGIRRANKEAVFFECRDLSPQLRNGVAQFAFALCCRRLERKLIFRAF